MAALRGTRVQLTTLTTAALLLFPAVALAELRLQAQTEPGLHHRTDSDAAAQNQAAGSSQSTTHVHLPEEAEGEYQWGDSGEVINLYVENGRLDGYLTQRSERRQVNSTPITFSFDRTTVHGSQITFTTQRIHGDWYSFTGSLVRGSAVSPRQQGYYLLNGTLSSHFHTQIVGEDARPEQSSDRVVSLKHGGLLP